MYIIYYTFLTAVYLLVYRERVIYVCNIYRLINRLQSEKTHLLKRSLGNSSFVHSKATQ